MKDLTKNPSPGNAMGGAQPNQSGSGAPGALRWLSALAVGLVVGLTAAFVMTLVMLLLRSVAGVSLPAELGADRILPTINVFTFLQLIAQNGGNVHAKEMAYYSGFAGQIALGAALGVIYAAIVERDRGRAIARRQATDIYHRGNLFIVAAVAVLWIGSLALFWPVLGSNYRGLPPGTATIVTALGLLVSYCSFGFAAMVIYRAMTSRSTLQRPTPFGPFIGRRVFLAAGAGVVGALASGALIRRLFDQGTFSYDGLQVMIPAMPHVTPNEDFYVVTKNLIDPAVSKDSWRLEISGLVDHPRTYGFADIAALPSLEQEMTLECISNPVGGNLISNAVWTGVPLRTLIEAAGPQAGVVEVLYHAADGYTFNAAFAKAMEPTTLVAYKMNGVPLPDRHGYPVRILTPGYYGEGNVKWITGVELVDHTVEDYYGSQGWKPRDVHTWSRFDQPHNGKTVKPVGGMVPLRGTAFAGNRGVAKVEVSADGGHSWHEATITYRGGRLTWAFWRYDWRPAGPGAHHLAVRATDDTGQLQTTHQQGPPPKGASGQQQIMLHVTA